MSRFGIDIRINLKIQSSLTFACGQLNTVCVLSRYAQAPPVPRKGTAIARAS